MPFVTARHIPEVVHIGHFERDLAPVANDLDGPGLAVSQNPEFWRSTRGLNAPEWYLSCPTAQWVDALALAEDADELRRWMLHEHLRYMKPATFYRILSWDDEKGDFFERDFSTLDEASAIVGRTADEEREAQSSGQGAVDEIEGYMLTRRAMRKLGDWSDPLRWFDAAVLLYTREVIMPKRPFVVGVWWNEAESEEAGTGPYGVLFPESLTDFSVADDPDDESESFADKFPDFAIPERKLV